MHYMFFQKYFFSILMFTGIIFLPFVQINANGESLSNSLSLKSLEERIIPKREVTQKNETTSTIVNTEKQVVKALESHVDTVETIQKEVSENVEHYFSSTKLIFAPTGRVPRSGEGYFFNYQFFILGIIHGINNYVSITAGVSIIPHENLSNKLLYIAPRIGILHSDKYALSIEARYISYGMLYSAKSVFSMVSLGR